MKSNNVQIKSNVKKVLGEKGRRIRELTAVVLKGEICALRPIFTLIIVIDYLVKLQNLVK